MATPGTQPLVRGLLGQSSGLVYAQMEIYFREPDTLEIQIRREPYSNLPDITFSMDDRDLDDLIDLLKQGKRALDQLWLSRLATRPSST